MKFLATIILLLNLLMLANCQKSEIKTENKLPNNAVNSLETKSLSKLYQAIKAKNIKAVDFKDDEIRIGKLKVRLTTVVEHDLASQGKWVFAARYETKLIGTSETVFTVGLIGIGNDKQDAEVTSIDEWIGLFGTAFVEMLAKSEGITIGNLKIYSGLMGIRGEKPLKGWLDASPKMNEKIINAVLPRISKSSREFDSLNLMISVNSKGEIEGECRFNNEFSEEILTELKNLKWDNSEAGYLFKQFYLLEKVQTK